ncbi:hypothetical protein LXL04_026926 [Taraxacum kok-saghyz]
MEFFSSRASWYKEVGEYKKASVDCSEFGPSPLVAGYKHKERETLAGEEGIAGKAAAPESMECRRFGGVMLPRFRLSVVFFVTSCPWYPYSVAEMVNAGNDPVGIVPTRSCWKCSGGSFFRQVCRLYLCAMFKTRGLTAMAAAAAGCRRCPANHLQIIIFHSLIVSSFQVGDLVLLKVSHWKGMVRFGKRGKLNPRYIGPFEILARIGPVAYKLKLPQELQNVHVTFHVSNLKKCLTDATLIIPWEEIHVNEKLNFVEEPVEIMDREVKRLKQSRIPIVKVRWSAKRGPEFTWEREDQMKQKYPHLFANSNGTSTS